MWHIICCSCFYSTVLYILWINIWQMCLYVSRVLPDFFYNSPMFILLCPMFLTFHIEVCFPWVRFFESVLWRQDFDAFYMSLMWFMIYSQSSACLSIAWMWYTFSFYGLPSMCIVWNVTGSVFFSVRVSRFYTSSQSLYIIVVMAQK